MRDLLGPGTWVGYCTNVHAGRTLQEVKDNLERYSCRVREMVCPGEELGIGLWLSASVARELLEGQDGVRRLKDWLEDRGLVVFTMNGFPYGDFHGDVVKHQVYQPDWTEKGRVAYTVDLINILCGLLPDAEDGSISTLPFGWPGLLGMLKEHRRLKAAIRNLHRIAAHAHRVCQEHGKCIHVDLEPEPGCIVSSLRDRYWLAVEIEDPQAKFDVYKYLRVCHDVCHAAVMAEDQRAHFEWARSSGLHIGKVQISSALRCSLGGLDAAARECRLQELASFAEERYLHQTLVRWDNRPLRQHRLFNDLPDALGNPKARLATEFRVHFHVPIYAVEVGPFSTTQEDITACLEALRLSKTENYMFSDRMLPTESAPKHFEIETYAWNVLPPEHRPADLAEGIARELLWFRDLVKGEIRP